MPTLTLHRFFCAVSFLCALCFSRVAAAEPAQVVVVTNESSAFQTLTRAELRQIYLGNHRAHRGITIRALFNDSEAHIREAFLQKTLFMSHKTYQYYAARGADRKEKIKFYRSEPKLLRDLQASRNSISFISADSAAKLRSVKIVATL